MSEKLSQQLQTLENTESSKMRNDMKKKIKENQSSELELNKTLKEVTSNKQELSTTLSSLVDELSSLEKQIEDLDFVDDIEDKDAIVLKLMVYRKLGLKIDMKSSAMIIYNKEKNLTDFLNYGDEKYSSYFISNYIWDRL
ncbi:hypothetical protein BN1211_2530 [Cyberlindnera jadinii]|nr:hypothetical protein BN1211_2530 [Cyberlindnera jadinii]